MEKGIAVSMILLLLVGSLVAGVTVYYTYRSVTDSPLSENECRGMMISWCIGCSNMGYSSSSGDMDPQLKECASKYWGMGHDNCDAKDDCSGFLPGGGGGGGGGTTTTAPTSCYDVGGKCRSPSYCEDTEHKTCHSNYFECDPATRCCCV